MMNRNNKGFTLIELLVVIAIIGMLATLAVVSLNSARKKARDAKRISDVSQIANALEVQDISSPSAGIDCGGSTALTTACQTPIQDLTWPNFKDPSNVATVCTPNEAVPGTPCGYTMVTGSTTGKYSICFYMEDNNTIGSGVPGLKTIKSGRVYQDGCVAP